MLILILLLAIILGGLYYGYRLAFFYQDPLESPLAYNRNDQTKDLETYFDQAIQNFASAACEDVFILARDGRKLTGRYYHHADGAPLQILFHGYKGNAIRDFAGVWPVAQELGHNVLLIDQRCHRTSQGHTITFGIQEHQDCLSWIDFANEMYGPVPTVLMGVSMGAATVLMASGCDLPDNIRGIVADCPYDAPANIIRKVLGTDMGMPVKLVYPLIRLGGILYGRFDLESYSPLMAVPRSRTPILLIHGDDDRFVPYEMSCHIHAAAPAAIEFHTIPGAGHALNQVAQPEQYHTALKHFLQTHL